MMMLQRDIYLQLLGAIHTLGECRRGFLYERDRCVGWEDGVLSSLILLQWLLQNIELGS